MCWEVLAILLASNVLHALMHWCIDVLRASMHSCDSHAPQDALLWCLCHETLILRNRSCCVHLLKFGLLFICSDFFLIWVKIEQNDSKNDFKMIWTQTRTSVTTRSTVSLKGWRDCVLHFVVCFSRLFKVIRSGLFSFSIDPCAWSSLIHLFFRSSIHPSIHPSIHSSIHSFIHWFLLIVLFNSWFYFTFHSFIFQLNEKEKTSFKLLFYSFGIIIIIIIIIIAIIIANVL